MNEEFEGSFNGFLRGLFARKKQIEAEAINRYEELQKENADGLAPCFIMNSAVEYAVAKVLCK